MIGNRQRSSQKDAYHRFSPQGKLILMPGSITNIIPVKLIVIVKSFIYSQQLDRQVLVQRPAVDTINPLLVCIPGRTPGSGYPAGAGVSGSKLNCSIKTVN